MSLITPIAALLGTELRASLRLNIRLAAIYGVAGLGVLGAIGFGFAALHRVIAQAQGPLYADLILGVSLLVFAGILIGIAQYMSYRARKRAALTRALMAAPIAAGALLQKPKVGIGALAMIVALGALAGRTFGK